jgi:ribonuclease BN (tRNA processing enzyme)
LRVTPVPVNHPSVSYGYLIEDEHSALFYSGDTGPTSEMWSLLSAFTLTDPSKRLTVFVDVKFPNRLPDLALASGHYTPALLEKDLEEKFEVSDQVQLLATHLSPRYPELVDEIRGIRVRGRPPGSVGIVEQDRVYEL